MEASHSQDTLVNQVSKPKRGKTRAEKWRKKRETTKGRVVIEIPKCLRRVVGDNAQQFITETSYLVKQICPLDVQKWSEIDQGVKDHLMSVVKEMFVLPNEAHVNEALWEMFKTRFSSWRYNLKKIYRRCKTDKERLSKCPPGVDPEKWKWLVTYWGTDKARHISEVNAENRRKQTSLACVGTKSIARIATEMRVMHNDDDEIDQEPEYLRLFVKQRQQKNGKWVDAEGEEGYKKLLKLHDEQLLSFNADNLSTEEAYTKVFGHKSGYIKGLGKGPRPLKCVKRTREYASQPIISESEFQARLKAELEVYNKKRDVEFQQTVTAIQNKFQEDLRKLKEELTSSPASEISVPRDLPSVPLKESANATSAAQRIDEGLNDSNVQPGDLSSIALKKSTINSSSAHKTTDSMLVRVEKHNSQVEKSSDMIIASQPKTSSTIPQSKPTKVSSIAQQNKTLGVKTVKLASKPLNDATRATCMLEENDQPEMLCVVCQINMPNMDAYKEHINGVRHKMTMENYTTKPIVGHAKTVMRKIKKEK